MAMRKQGLLLLSCSDHFCAYLIRPTVYRRYVCHGYSAHWCTHMRSVLVALADVNNYHNHLGHVYECVRRTDLGKRQSAAVVMCQMELERNISGRN